MKPLNVLIRSIVTCCFAASLTASPIGVSASSSFTGGLLGGWRFDYVSGAPGVQLQQISINLGPTDLRFDTAAGGFGSLSFQDIGGFGGTATFDTVSEIGTNLDGDTLLTFGFSNFTPGMYFDFAGDVDHPDPTLLALQNCAGKTGLALLVCNLGNAGKIATNGALLLGAQSVGPNQMAGAEVTFTFGGSGYETTEATGAFGNVTLPDIIGGLLAGEGRNAFNTTADVYATAIPNPEPASLAMFGAGLCGLAIAARRRLSKR